MTTTPTTRRDLRAQAALDGTDASRSTPEPERGRGVAGVLGEVVLWIAAVAGSICIVLVILAFTANITLIMFRTGSMSPTIPAGSVAVVQRVPASEIALGDIVTVDRPGELPGTHRITSIEPGPSEAERVITMRGDANAADDPLPYTVESVRRVLFSIPGIATVIVAMGSPYVLGGITIAATLLVVWAFWPRDSRAVRSREARGVSRDAGGGDGS